MSGETELIIADAEYSGAAEKYYTFATQMDGYVKEYVTILDQIVSQKCLQGTVAEKLSQFSALVSQMLSGQLAAIMKTQKRQMNDYISSVDDADEYLY